MESSFAALGEGHILGTMPAYLERFGAGNARFVARHFLAPGPVEGPEAALSPMRFVSLVTDTEAEEIEQGTARLKRLHHCEFEGAFRDRGEFPRAMMCMLHRAAYQGSVNGLVDGDRFDVHLQRRILFGDATCDFVVVPREPSGGHDTALPMAKSPTDDERNDLAYYFYTFLLTSFVDYLTHHLPSDQVESIMRSAARKVGRDVSPLLETLDVDTKDPVAVARAVMQLSGRTLKGDSVEVTACPQAQAIHETARGDDAERDAVRANACRLCKHFLAGIVESASPDACVERSTSIARGDRTCDYRVTC